MFYPVPPYSLWDGTQVSEEGDCSHQVTLGVHEPAANSDVTISE